MSGQLASSREALAGQLPIPFAGIGLTAKPASLGSSLPLVETEDYGWPGEALANGKMQVADEPALLVGAVYADANGNGKYDPGEGVAGVTVSMDGGAYYAVTGASGGYALPLVNADGSSILGAATVRMGGGALGGDRVATVAVALHPAVNGNQNLGSYRANVKWDAVANQTAGGGGAASAALSGGGTVSRAAGGKASLTITRTGADLGQPLPLTLKTGGTAQAGVDYKLLPATVTIPAGAVSLRFKIKVLPAAGGPGSPATVTLILKLKGVKGAVGKASVTITS